MPITEAKCTNCGANLSVDSANDAAICPYCNSAFIVEKAIQNYTFAITNNNHITAEVVNIVNGNNDFLIKAGRLIKYEGASVNVVIPDSVKVIGSRAFAGLDLLEAVVISKGVKVIEQDAFADCINLTSVSLSDTVERIEPSAFENCERISAIDIPPNVAYIGLDAFAGCDRLCQVSYNNIHKCRDAFRYTPIYFKLVGKEWQCQFCDTTNPPDAKFCKTCGIENINAEYLHGVDLKWKCPECLHKNYPEDYICASCCYERSPEDFGAACSENSVF